MRLLMLLSELVSLLSAAEGGSGSLNQQTHWFGNTYSGSEGGKPRWMMMGVDNFVVAGDRSYCFTGWEERGGEANIYSTTGEFVSKPETWHSWGWFGGSALADDDAYVYYGIGHNENDGGGRNFSGIARFSRNGTPANFEGGIEGGFRLAVNDNKEHILPGVAVSGGELFVVEPVRKEIVVFSTATMLRVRSFPLPGAGRLIVDHSPERALWVIDTPSKTVFRIGRDGKDLGVRIRDCLDPVALALTPDGDLLVADGDPGRQRIQRYHGATAQRVSGADFGTPINQGSKPGSVMPGRFLRITGIACGDDGALYVSSWDYGGKLWKFDAQRKFVWVLQGTEFVSCADADPGDDTSIYSAGHRYVLDYSKPPGQNWRDAAITFDPLRYPQDPRVGTNWMATRCVWTGEK